MTDGGIETTLIFHDGLDLPHFAAFELLKTTEGRAALERYFRTYVDLAARLDTGLVLESATWRANPDWGAELGYDADALAAVNHEAVELLAGFRDTSGGKPLVISGCVGPRGDGYVADTAMTPEEAAEYHSLQARAFAVSAADLVTAITMTYADEAAGVAMAAREAGMPVVLSFTVETDGRLPTGQPLHEAIGQVDQVTAAYPAYYMINCAHPDHFAAVLDGDAAWTRRVRGLRANASRMSHEELDEAPELDEGDPGELGAQYAALRAAGLPHLNVMGGCCGTDHRHIEAIATACMPAFEAG
jgi:homocysteine S-methyltransferase